MKKRLLALLLALAMGLSLMACSVPSAENPSPSPSDTPPDPAYSSTQSPQPTIEADLSQDVLTFSAGSLVDGEPLLTVNGTPVSNSLMLYWLFYCCNYYEQQLYYYGIPLSLYASAILEETFNLGTYYTVLVQKADELGCILTDEQVSAIAEDMELEGDAHKQRKELYGLSDGDLMLIYSLPDLYDNLTDMLIPDPTVEDLNNYVYQVKHILITTAASAADGKVTLSTGETVDYAGTVEEYNAEALAKAEGLLAQIRAAEDTAATFDALMHEHSQDGRDASGNLGAPDGYTATPGQMVAEFEQTAFAIGVGEVSDVVKSTYGYHIILRGEVENIENYTEQWIVAQMDAKLSQWTGEAEVSRSDALTAEQALDIYERYYAWQQAYSLAQQSEK